VFLTPTTPLEGVLDTYYTARRAAGIHDPFNITFEEYVERLIQAAQPHDATLSQNRGRASQSANFHSILGDESDEEEDSDNEDDPRASLEVFKSDWDCKSGGRKECKKDDRFYKKPGAPTKQHSLIPRTKWNTLSCEDQVAWSKISESAKKTILGTPDSEKGRDNNPSIVVINNHKMIFEDEEEDEGGNVNHSISAQSHSSSNRSIVASVHQSDPTRRTIQANTSTLRNTEESKYQDPEERGLLYMATHKMTKSNRQIDVNNAFSKAVEKKSTGHVTWDNDIEQPTTERYKKPQIRVNMASRKKVVFKDDGTIVESPDDEEQATLDQAIPTPCTAVSTQPGTYATICGNSTRPCPTMNNVPGRGRGRGSTPGSHYFGAGGQGGRRSQASTPDGRTHLIPRSVRNTLPQQSVNKRYVPGVNISSSQQSWLSRHMGATNPTTSYVARLRYRLACRPGHPMVNYGGTDMLSDASNNPHRTGIREDGTFIEDQVDATGNSLAMIPYGDQPDPIVSQQAIVTTHTGSTTENSTNALVVHQTPYGLRNSALTYAGRAVDNPVQGISFREDGTMYGPGIDEEVPGVLKQDCTTKTHGIQGSEQQDEGKAHASPPIASSQSGASIDHQDDPQDVNLGREANADSKRGAVDDPQDINLLERGLINDPQDVGLGREEQVDPQPIPAPSLQDIDGDNKHEQQSHSDHDAETGPRS